MRALLFVAIVISLSACNVYKGWRLEKAKSCKVSTLVDAEKKIAFLGLVHVGKPEFYESVVKEVTRYKKEGYVLFYEDINSKDVTDEGYRKFRRLVGFLPNDKGYKQKTKKGLIAQNTNDYLHLVNDKDFNVDVSVNDVINEIERKYGEIVLDSIDLHRDLDSAVRIKESFKNTLDVVVNYRNEHVFKEILASKYDKILVVYGDLHKKGIRKLLKKHYK